MNETIYFYTKSGPYFELSNFAPYGVEIGGRYWPTVEHYFQGQKFSNSDYQDRIRQATSPKEARALGQSRSRPIREDWDVIRDEVMLLALRKKFERPDLQRILLGTGDSSLVEASPFDYYWGAGQDGSGQNRLGMMLEQVRSEIRHADIQHDNASDAPKSAADFSR